MSSPVSYSIVVPVYNEEGNIEILSQKLTEVLQRGNVLYEIIFADDGSTDNSFQIIKRLAQSDSHVRGISL